MIRTRTCYSFRHAYGDLPEVFDQLIKTESKAFPITDRGSTFGFWKWSKLCKEREVSPIYGVELAVTPLPAAKKPIYDYWTFLAKSKIEPIHELVRKATSQFRYQPLLTYSDALQAKGVVKVAGYKSLLPTLRPNGIEQKIYYELSPATNKRYAQKMNDLGAEPVTLYDNRYPVANDKGAYQVTGGFFHENKTYPQHILGINELDKCLKAKGHSDHDIVVGFSNAWAIARECKGVKLESTGLIGQDSFTEKDLIGMCYERVGVLDREGRLSRHPSVYFNRLEEEVRIIDQKNYMDYFAIVLDIVRFAEKNHILIGPGRGSAGGSLFCYLLGITKIDPIKYDLLFSRFIDINRTDLPDIDLDFPDFARPQIIEYLKHKYGVDHIAKLGTVAYYRSRAALHETAKATDMPHDVMDKVQTIIDETPGGSVETLKRVRNQISELASGNPELVLASKIEGTVRHSSQHPSAVILSDKPVSKIAAIDSRNDNLMLDMIDAESAGLLKIDILGLRQLSVFTDVLRCVNLKMDYILGKEPNDENVLNILRNGKYCGIFQFYGKAMQKLCSSIKLESFDDICIINALSRPGPAQSGNTASWVKHRNAGRIREIKNEKLRESGILDATQGVLVYQEQVMRICREIGKFSWPDTIAVRKAIGKSQGAKAIEPYRLKFINQSGIPQEQADALWTAILNYGKYAFNKSHSVAYSWITYVACYLKYYYPLEFAAATLDHEKDKQRKIEYLQELRADGVRFFPYLHGFSGERWRIYKSGEISALVAPLTNIVGIGPKFARQMLNDRAVNKNHSPGIQKKLDRRIFEISQILSFKDELNMVCPDLKERNIVSVPFRIDVWNKMANNNHGLVIGKVVHARVKDKNDKAKIKGRGYPVNGFSQYVSLKISDDTGEIYVRMQPISEFHLDKMIPNIKPGAIWAFIGRLYIRDDFRMIFATKFRFLGRV